MRSRRRIPYSKFQKIVRRLLRSNRTDTDTPVIISTIETDRVSSGRLLEREGGRILALVDAALERERAVTVFFLDRAYFGEVLSCVAQGRQFTVELVLIQYRDSEA